MRWSNPSRTECGQLRLGHPAPLRVMRSRRFTRRFYFIPLFHYSHFHLPISSTTSIHTYIVHASERLLFIVFFITPLFPLSRGVFRGIIQSLFMKNIYTASRRCNFKLSSRSTYSFFRRSYYLVMGRGSGRFGSWSVGRHESE